MLHVGTSVILTVGSHDEFGEESYRANVIEVRPEFIYIDYPIGEKTNKTVFLPVHTHIRVSYVGKDEAAYSFTATIIAREKLTIPALKLPHPEQSAIKKIQRRQYVRIETAVDVAVQPIKNNKKAFTTVTLDISGGGLSIITADEQLVDGELVDVTLVLPFLSGEFIYVRTQAEVIRTQSENNVQSTSLGFIEITDKDRQAIIRFCFEKQREARRKERQ